MKKRNPKNQTEYFVNEVISRPVSKKEFLKLEKQRMNEVFIPQSSLIERKIFTKSEIAGLISMKILTPVKHKSRIYFKKDDVAVGIKSLPEQLHLE